MELPAAKVLKSFIGSEEPEPIARSNPAVSKYPSRSKVDQLATMPRDQPKAHPPITKSQSAFNIDSSMTLPHNLGVASGSLASVGRMSSISEDQHDNSLPSSSSQDNLNNPAAIFRRKGAMKKPNSSWRSTFDGTTAEEQEERYPLRRTTSDIPQDSLSPYNPDKPLIKRFPLKKNPQVSRARSIKTTIGPLTKEVCEQLDIQVELDDPSTKVAFLVMHTCMITIMS